MPVLLAVLQLALDEGFVLVLSHASGGQLPPAVAVSGFRVIRQDHSNAIPKRLCGNFPCSAMSFFLAFACNRRRRPSLFAVMDYEFQE